MRRAALLATATMAFFSAVPSRGQDAAPPTATPADAAPGTPKPRPSLRDDKRRTMKSYWNNIAYNFLGVATSGNHTPLLVTGALTATAFAWDDEGKKYFAQHPHTNFGKIGSQMGGSVAVAGLTIGFFSAGRMVSGDRFRATTYDLSQAIIVNQVWTQALKLAIRRERPDESNRVSFPSGHSSNAYCAAAVITRHYPRLAVPGYAVATYIAVSRMAANKHHFSDIVAGAGFGYGVGRLVTRRNSREPDAPATTAPAARLDFMPDAGPTGDGAGVRLVLTF